MKTETSRLPGVKMLQGMTGWAWTVFFVVLLAELVGAYIVVYRDGFIMNDAMARTANAYYVLNILPNKLASIGFVWNPLPSMLQLPILAFSRFWPPLATHGLSGSIVTALFAAVNASCLYRYFNSQGKAVGLPLLIVFLYAFNPFVFYYGLNGMSETIFFTVLIVGIYNFVLWTEDRANGRLLVVALMLAVGFLTRYEILTLILGFASSLLVAILLMEDKHSPFKHKPLKMKFDYTISTSLVMFLPVLYVIAIWVAVCWAIMGDPIYFLRSAYSNESQSGFIAVGDTRGGFRDPATASIYVLVHSLPFIILFIVIVGERLLTWRILKYDMLVLILLVGCFFGFHFLLLLSGRSFGWLRFFSYSLPACMAWCPYELSRLKHLPKFLTSVAICLGLAVSGFLIPGYFADPDLASEEYTLFYRSSDTGVNTQLELAKIINAKYSHATILLDSFTASAMILNLKLPENIITTTSDNFMYCVKDPQNSGIDYIVTVLPKGVGYLDAINRQYPDLYYYGVPNWAELVESRNEYRLYKVLPKEEVTGSRIGGN